MFARYCGQSGAGRYQTDAVQLGINHLTGRCLYGTASSVIGVTGNVTIEQGGEISGVAGQGGARAAEYYITQRTAAETRPVNVAQPVALSLGRYA